MPGVPLPEPYQLPNIPSNAYTLLSNLATAIDTANTKLTGHANKVRDINTSTNNAVSHVVTTSKGQATDALGILWTDSKTDLSHAHDQLSAITTPSQGIGPGPNDFQATLDQYKGVIQTGLTALDNLRQHQSSNGVVYLSPFNQQMMQWKQEVDQLDNALANINIVLDGIAMAIRGLNNGFRAACATGLTPGAPPPLFNKNAFAHQSVDGSGGGGSQPSNDELLNDHYLVQKDEMRFDNPDAKTAFDNTLKHLDDVGGPLGNDVVPTEVKVNPGHPEVDGLENGMSTKDGKRGWRIDFDDKKGIHFNWYDWTKGSRKSGFGRWGSEEFPGTYQDYLDLLLKLNEYGPSGMFN